MVSGVKMCPPSRGRTAWVRGAAAVWMLAGLATRSLAQPGDMRDMPDMPDMPDLATAESLDIPTDLPGHERGDRVRQPEPEVIPEETAEPTPREWFGGKRWWEWSAATGDWAGARAWLSDRGIEFAGSWTLDWSSVWSGGVRKVASTRTLLDANVSFDLSRLAGIEGATVFVDFYSTDARGGWDDSGDYQGTSSIQTADNVDQVAELWWEQRIFDDVLRFKIGKIDANSEFAFPGEASGGFLNSAAAYSPTEYFVLPSYPDPALGAVAFLYPAEHWYLGAGFFDGSMSAGKNTGRLGPHPLVHGDEFFWIGETGCAWNDLGGLGAGRIAAGAWYHSGDFARFDGAEDEDGSAGFYFAAQQQFWRREGTRPEDAKGLFAFAQYGRADEDVSFVGHHVGVGLALEGTFAGREVDAAGFYWSWCGLTGADGSGAAGDESVIELFYKVQVTPWLSIRPDLQYVVNPSGNPEIEDAVVGGVRLEVTF